MPRYRFFIEPISEGANEAIAELLNRRADSAESLVQDRLLVAGRKEPVSAYEVPEHYVLTLVKRSGQLQHFRAYVQEGSGTIRPYHHFQEKKRSLQQSQSVKRAQQRLEAMRRRRRK